MRYKHCAECGEELGEMYWTILDNYLQVKYFEDIDGKDNAFCSSECLLQSISAEEVENEGENE